MEIKPNLSPECQTFSDILSVTTFFVKRVTGVNSNIKMKGLYDGTNQLIELNAVNKK